MNKRKEQLGVHPATASGRLLRDLLFHYVMKESHKCFRCDGELERDNFSIEHKIPWLNSDNPIELFYDLDNITYSHQKCNYGAHAVPHKLDLTPKERAERNRLKWAEYKRNTYNSEKRSEKYRTKGY